MIFWAPVVFSVLYACALCFCIWPCSAQVSMFNMERRSTNMPIIVIIYGDDGRTAAGSVLYVRHVNWVNQKKRKIIA